ncbi:MAG: hypothetical protein HZT39_09650 [Pseudoxanthomonas sp.]|nr:MAG: hypothetical protein HZT39_09650 [Pseudoxanthomonas sp.]
MGTDIHGRIQWRDSGGRWFDDGPIEDGRSYRLFAALAGVRNGIGFAGVFTHDAITPIAEPRGLPDDNVAYPNEGDVWFGDHTFSWLSFPEITSWDGWDKPLSDAPTIPLRERCDAFMKWLAWQEARQFVAPEDVRIVFGFDS